jgi:hypothetical protein
MLSDACSHYLASGDTIIGATYQLARDVEHYSDPPFKYPDEMIRALRIACQTALDHGDMVSVEHLDSLATSVMKHLDAPWLYPDWRPVIIDAGDTTAGGN